MSYKRRVELCKYSMLVNGFANIGVKMFLRKILKKKKKPTVTKPSPESVILPVGFL